ncbi:hypothetical protein [Rhizobium ecuadorense]|uniref:hypothetical protein n=1 Tax=Rhizobium ecuadorense TaxID=1671795 RepID=UPI0006733D22|nr:hypothetical protein [Rhizobium ecuadorense]
MTFIAFLNELSFPQGQVDQNAAEASVVGLVKTLQALRRVQPSTALHSSVSLASIPIGADNWLGQIMATGRNRDEWRFLRGFENRAPFRVGLGETFAMDSEYHFGNQPAEGLGLSHAVGTLSVSFANNPWIAPTVELRRIFLSDDGDCEGEMVEVSHASTADHIAAHDNWLRRMPLERVRDGDELWVRREEIFPHLRFLPRTEAYIRSFKAGEVRFTAAGRTLMDLEVATSRWNTTQSPMPTWLTLTSAEAEQRSKKFNFDDLDGVERCFDWHARYTPGAGRIHFWCDRANGLLMIGHVGEKVPD